MKLRLTTLFLLLFSACGADSGTGGRQVAFKLGVSTQGPVVPGTFENDLGWKISLTEATLSMGPVYLLEKRPALGLIERVWNVVVPSAHAHPGDDFFAGGKVLGEWTEIETVDLLSETSNTEWGSTLGVAGNIRSMSIGFGKKPLRLKGSAEKDGQTIPFEWESIEGLHPESERVDFVPVDVALDDNLTLWVEVNWPKFFEGVQMNTLNVSQESVSTTQAYRAIHLNLRRNTAWSLVQSL